MSDFAGGGNKGGMAELSDMDLLRDFNRRGAEEAFTALVERHVNLVYSVALRHTGIPAQAEEITQAVFVILAREAASLRPDTVLESWLHQTTRLTALRFMRGERRRQFREQEAYMRSTIHEATADPAWQQLALLLDEALARLGQADRDAVILRFFKDKSLREVAAAMNMNEAAAQRRVLRAVEKMRVFFTRRGVVLSASAVTAAIAANSVQAAPALLAKTAAVMAVGKDAAASGSTVALIKGALKLMAWTKTKNAIVAGASVLLAAVTATVVVNKIENHNGVVGKYPKPWTFVGRATPEDSLQSFFAAQSQGDLQTVQDSYSAKSWAAIMDYVNAHPNYRDGFAASTSNNVKNVTVFYILKERRGSGGVFLNVKEDGGINTNVWKTFMMKIGGEWKLATPGDSSDDAFPKAADK